MFLAPNQNILEWFVKDHAALKTETLRFTITGINDIFKTH